jgi:hypothetical protein
MSSALEAPRGRSWIGSMSGSIDIVGDVVAPIIDIETIEAISK